MKWKRCAGANFLSAGCHEAVKAAAAPPAPLASLASAESPASAPYGCRPLPVLVPVLVPVPRHPSPAVEAEAVGGAAPSHTKKVFQESSRVATSWQQPTRPPAEQEAPPPAVAQT